jgi:hypothetical protein
MCQYIVRQAEWQGVTGGQIQAQLDMICLYLLVLFSCICMKSACRGCWCGFSASPICRGRKKKKCFYCLSCTRNYFSVVIEVRNRVPVPCVQQLAEACRREHHHAGDACRPVYVSLGRQYVPLVGALPQQPATYRQFSPSPDYR